MKKNMLRKTLVIGIAILFFGVSVVSSTGQYIERLLYEHEQSEVIENSIVHCNDVFEAYAYVAYFPGGQEGLHGFDLEDPGTLELISPGMSFLSGACFVPPSYIYFSEYATGILWIFDIITLKLYIVGGGGMGLNGMDYDDDSGFLYAVVSNDLYKINKQTGEQTYIGGWTTSHIMSSIAINDGICYAHDVLNDAIYIINLDTAELTLLGDTGFDSNYGSDMAFDKDNDTLYLAAYTSSGSLYICDTITGNCSLVGDFEGGAEVTGLAIPYYNQPPNEPTIVGPTRGNPNTEYDFSFNTTDPDGDAVMYNIDWGDNNTEWTEYGDSGVEIILKHTWETSGNYSIKAQAIDINGAESDWTNYTVTIPRSKAIINPILYWLHSNPNFFPLLQKLLQQMGFGV
jgi:hypothetical protein